MSAFSHCRCRLVTRPSLPRIVEPIFSLYLLVLEIIQLVPLLASQTIPVMASVPVSLVFSYVGCLSVSKRRAFAILYNSTIELIGIWGLSNV